MAAPLPDPEQVHRAIDVYLNTAYTGELPLRVRSQMKVLGAWHGKFFRCSVFAHDDQDPPTRYYIRLGNPFYPHMKLAVELPPGGDRFVYRVDTHDRHCCPAPGANEYSEFCDLMAKNKEVADRIESAWDAAGVPTFKAYLKEDLQRRHAAIQS
jgi:hypothetical protein